MQAMDRGVSQSSEIFIHIPSEFALKALYNIPYVGRFQCTENYRISRDYLNMFLLVFVDEGEMYITYRDKTVIAGPKDVVLLDCKEPHIYGASGSLVFRFFHFNGAGSQPYFDLITAENGFVFKPLRRFKIDGSFDLIYQTAKDNFLNEDVMSIQVHSILSELALSKYEEFNINNSILYHSIAYIEKNFSREELSVKDIAEQANLSVFYFSRVFKRFFNKSPHEYLVNLRLTFSQQMLVTTNKSIESIASECGFKSTTHFIRAFKKTIGVTPKKFRQLSI